MAINRSPEFNSSNQCSRAFWYLRPPFKQTQASSTLQSTIPNFKHLSQVVLKLQIFSYCLHVCISLLQTQEPLAYGYFGLSDLDLNKIGKGPLGNATYLISST